MMRRSSPDLTDPARNIEESVGTPDPSTVDTAMDLASSPLEPDDSTAIVPPPRVAARFYRPSQIRRKGSAASSRRNSMSSAHSRSSHGFVHHGGDQSKYIAQQLRRASIIEDRKARLADRAAHAEKVRLRAANAKAAPQKSLSQSEERAQAAAQAREKNLAEIVAACAEEVKRAKAIAESMKEKRELELQRLRLQLEERQADAEKRREERREELRKTQAARRSRGSSLGNKKPAPLSDAVAASKIQWWWRSSMRKRAVCRFSGLGLNIDGVRENSFEQVTDLLSQETVLTTTAAVLRICGLKEGDAASVDEMAAVRTFLSAFLILGHPTPVLSSKDGNGGDQPAASRTIQHMSRDNLASPQSQDLVGKARDLLICFENILSRLTSYNYYTLPPALQESLPEAYATYHNAFIAWKARDSNALIEVMLMQFVELDAILETVKERTEEPVTDTYRQSIKDNQLMLMVRIKRLKGPQEGKKLIFDAVKQARKARAERRPSKDTRPRTTEDTLGGGSSSADHANAEQAVTSQLQTLTPPPTPGPSDRQEPLKLVPQPSYPPILPDNRVIVHELAINREYRIELKHFQEQHKLRMDPVFDDLKSGEKNTAKEFQYLIVMANYIRDRLQHLVKAGSPTHKFIGELLDTEVAQQQFIAGSFSFEKFFSTMGSLLPKLCAPARDDEAKVLVEDKLRDGHVVDRLEALMSFIDIMVYDYANYMLQVATPDLAKHVSPYEAKRFAEDLDSGATTLSKAKASWRQARRKLHAEASRRDPEGINHPRLRPSPDKIYWQMLLDEFTQPSPSPDQIPEPLALDTDRRARLGRQTLRIATAGAILLQCKNILKRDVRAPWKTEASRIFAVLESMDDPDKRMEQAAAVDGIMAALEPRSMPAATKKNLRALVTKVIAATVEAKSGNAEPSDPVSRLLLTRVRAHILMRLQANSASEKVKATSTAGEKLASLGMPEFVEKVRELVDEMAKVGIVDRDAHGIWWEEVAEGVEKEESAAADQAGSHA